MGAPARRPQHLISWLGLGYVLKRILNFILSQSCQDLSQSMYPPPPYSSFFLFISKRQFPLLLLGLPHVRKRPVKYRYLSRVFRETVFFWDPRKSLILLTCLVFIFWCPENCAIRQRMMAATGRGGGRDIWPGLCLFCCYQPRVLSANRADLGFFSLVNIAVLNPPPPS